MQYRLCARRGTRLQPAHLLSEHAVAADVFARSDCLDTQIARTGAPSESGIGDRWVTRGLVRGIWLSTSDPPEERSSQTFSVRRIRLRRVRQQHDAQPVGCVTFVVQPVKVAVDRPRIHVGPAWRRSALPHGDDNCLCGGFRRQAVTRNRAEHGEPLSVGAQRGRRPVAQVRPCLRKSSANDGGVDADGVADKVIICGSCGWSAQFDERPLSH